MLSVNSLSIINEINLFHCKVFTPKILSENEISLKGNYRQNLKILCKKEMSS